QYDLNFGADTSQGFIDRVVHDLPQAVHGPTRIGRLHVHARTLTYRLQALEHQQIACVVRGLDRTSPLLLERVLPKWILPKRVLPERAPRPVWPGSPSYVAYRPRGGPGHRHAAPVRIAVHHRRQDTDTAPA